MERRIVDAATRRVCVCVRGLNRCACLRVTLWHVVDLVESEVGFFFGKVGVHYLNHRSLCSAWLFVVFCYMTMKYSALTALCRPSKHLDEWLAGSSAVHSGSGDWPGSLRTWDMKNYIESFTFCSEKYSIVMKWTKKAIQSDLLSPATFFYGQMNVFICLPYRYWIKR